MELLQRRVALNVENMTSNITKYFKEDIIEDIISVVHSKEDIIESKLGSESSLGELDPEDEEQKEKDLEVKKSPFGIMATL